MKKKHNYLRNPQGTEGLSFEQADLHRQASNALESYFYNWGYTPVKTPVFDFYDIYEHLLDKQHKANTYRLIDRDGDLLMLRSDITLFLAKQMGRILKKEDLPARVYYSDTILRHQDSVDVSKNEFYQSGAELIGKPGIEGDLEITMLLCGALEKYDAEFFIHIGSRALFNAVFSDLSTSEKEELISLILNRDIVALEAKASQLGISSSDKAAELFSVIAEAADAEKKLNSFKGIFSEQADKELENMITFFNELNSCSPAHTIRLDLSELGAQPYYTGFVFSAYADYVGNAAASGGRYDKLLKGFGFDSCSAGFSIMTRKLDNSFSAAESVTAEKVAQSNSFAEQYAKASKLISEGKRVKL